jgi:pimeloyl-ACP methyl ester carboxylesterase
VVAAALLATVSLFTSGCLSSYVANRIVRAPNQQRLPREMKMFADVLPSLSTRLYSLDAKVAVRPHPAEIAFGVLEPGNYGLQHRVDIAPDVSDEKNSLLEFELKFKSREQTQPSTDPKGTIVILHGVMMPKESMLHWGLFLAQKGYRVVLVDLRGHGQSTGDVISYGAWEPADLSQVLDDLARRQLVAGRVGVLGLSYGGAIAIDWAARDPRIDAVVALAPFSDARRAIHEFARAVEPRLTRFVGDTTMDSAIDLAARRAGFTWEETDVVASARLLHQPVLLFHGRNDNWISPTHSEQIKAAAPAGSQLLLGPGNHVTISLRLSPMAEQVTAWFDRRLTGPPATN